MRKVFTKIVGSIFYILLCTVLGQAQTIDTIYAGDMNNNGIVSAVDLLYWGQEYGETGPVRNDSATGLGFTPQIQGFNNKYNRYYKDPLYSIDISHGDSNGDGVIDDVDLEEEFKPNYGLTHGEVKSEGYKNGVPNVDPPLRMIPSTDVIETGDSLTIAFELGNASFPIDSFYGIAFSYSYEAEFVEDSAPIKALDSGDGWNNNISATSRQFVANNEATGKGEYVMVKTDKQSTGFVKETVGVFSIVIDDFVITPITADTILTITIDSVRMIDHQFRTHPVDIDSASVDIIVLNTERSDSNSNCPDTFDPVCASDGNTYHNSCYAEAAGVFDYTLGVCFGDCIDPNQIDDSVPCDATDQIKVCGCNGETYNNACEADNAGVLSYTSGSCNSNDNCIDVGAIFSSGKAKTDDGSGVMFHICNETLVEPVCGCNGVTYQNSCYAEISGVQNYTSGECADVCIDPSAITQNIGCANVYNPVCGCNDVTYNNPCFAEAAGVVSYTAGQCDNGGGSVVDNWCTDAQAVYCGDILFNQTNAGEDNDFSSYSVLPNYTLLAPDKIYTLNKTTTGDLQITLEITTPNLDLDLFLFQGECNVYSVIEGSWSDNQLTNIETIIVEDAPLGNYYIVVDGQYANSIGEFRLDVSCGYLDCSNAIDLTCGQPHTYSNSYGEDNISVYTCDGNNSYNNNGPEVVHTVTTTATGQLDITLSNLNANLNMYLLSACDHTLCIDNSTNAGTWNENISAYVPAGTYYIVVDGYNGATSSYNLSVDCAQDCSINVNATATVASCGQNSGTITAISSGGTPGYVVSYSGPANGSLYTASNSATIPNLPSGTYTVEMTDANGCSDYAAVVINDGSNLTFSTWLTDATCGMGGAIEISVSNGSAPYTVSVSGPENQQVTAYSNSININDLVPGTYTIQILDAYGCSSQQQVTIGDDNTGFTYTATGNPANCGQLGSISVNIPAPFNTQNPFNIQLSGPVSGFETTNSSSFNIINLPGGTYSLLVENQYWCQETQVVVIEDNYMTIGTTTTDGICGQDGSITVNISNGTASYYVQWSGQESGNAWVSNPNYTINNLASGTYTVSVTDDNGCTDYEAVQIDNTTSYLNTDAIAIDGTCGYGSIWIDMLNGNAPYNIYWNGPVSDFATTTNDGFDIQDIPAGAYTITITDANGCTSTEYVTVDGSGSDLDITVSGTNGICGQNGSIWISMTGGTAPYSIAWNGPSSGSTSIPNNTFDISNLPTGSYTISVTDTNGCTDTDNVYIYNSTQSIDVTSNVINGTCGQNGSIWLTWSGGLGAYTIAWSGPSSGSDFTANTNYDISNIPSGDYTITITDSNGCYTVKNVTVYDGTNDLNISATGYDEACGNSGSIWINISGGNAPYTIAWSGDANGSGNTSSNGYSIPNLWAGNYNVIVTDANGCTDAIYVTLSGNQGLDISLWGTDGTCGGYGAIEVSITGGTSAYTVAWSGASTGNASTSNNMYIIPNLNSGSYTVSVTDANGCVSTETITINQTNNLDISLWGTDGTCGGYGAIEVSITGGTSAYTVAWSGASTGNASTSNNMYIIPNLNSGSYTVSVTDSNGCVSTETITINQTNNLDISLWGTDGTCGGYGAIEVSITGGTSAYTVAWSGASTGNATTSNNMYIIPNLNSGSYTVSVTDSNGCVSTETITINQTNNLDISLWGTDGTCGGYGAIEVSITSGTSAYTVAWSGASTGNASTSNNMYIIPNLNSGSYTVSVTDSNGCVSTETITINQTNNLDISLWGTDGTCGGYGAIEVSITGGTSAYTVAWSGASTGNATTSNNMYIIPNLNSGAYTVSVTDTNGCVSTETITINQTNNLDISLWGTDGTCGGYGAIEVSITGGTADYTVAWGGTSSGSILTSNSTYILPDLSSGAYTVSVTDTNGCVSTESTTINQTNDIDITLSGTNVGCGTLGSIDIEITGGTGTYSIAWGGPSPGSSSTNNTAYTIPNLVDGLYTITVQDANGCSVTETVSIYDLYNNLNITATPYNGACGQYGSIWVDVVGGVAGYTIAWSGQSTGSILTNSTSYEIETLATGTYTISVTDSNGCSDTQTVNITNGTNNLSVTTEVVNGTCGTLGSIWVNFNSGSPNYLITWNGPSNGQATTAANAYSIPNLTAGNYTLSVTDSNGCTFTESLYIQVGTGNLTMNATGNDGTCGTYGSIDVSISGGTAGYIVSWSGSVTGSTNISGASHTIPNLPAGSYNVMVTDASGCGQSEYVTISTSNGNFNATISGNNGACGSNGSIDVTWNGGTPTYTLAWSGTSNGSTTVSGGSHSIPNLPVGGYNVSLTDGNGCIVSAYVSVASGNGTLSVSTVSYDAYCSQAGTGSIWLDINGGTPPFNIAWSGQSTGSANTTNDYYEIINLDAGSYTIVITDANGCADTEIATVNSDSGSVSVTATASSVYCNSTGNIHLELSGGAPNYTIQWNGPTQGSSFIAGSSYDITNAGAGTYTISVSDANGCSTTETIVVNSSGGNLSVNTTATDSYCGVPGSIWVAIGGGAAPYTVSWSGTATGSNTTSDVGYSIPNVNAGSYNITVTDSNGCTATSSVTVSGSGGTLDATVTGSAAYCDLPGSIWIIINNGNPSYTIEWSGPSSGTATTGVTYDIPDLPAGTYTLIITDANGCSITKTVIIENNASSLDFAASPTNAACGVAGSIWLTMSAGSAPYDIGWTGTSTGAATTNDATYNMTNLSAGTYYVTVTDNSNCSVSKTVIVDSSGNNLSVGANPTNSNCGIPGSIWVTISGGSATYTVEWNGTQTGTATTNDAAYDISGLSMGDYGITVTDATGCSAVQTVTVQGSVGLDVTMSPHNGSCTSGDGDINVVVNNGSPNYSVFWNGPVTNSAILTGNSITIDNLPSGDYTVSVEDANGCSYTEVITITNSASNPTASFTYTTDILTLNTNNTSSTGTYSWDFGDLPAQAGGNTSTDTNPVYQFCEPGTYNVCMTVTNTCGSTTHCETVTVSIPSNVCTIDVGEVSATPGATVYLPVTVQNCNPIASFAGSLDIVDPTIATIAGLSPGAIAPQYNSTDQTFNYYDNNGQGIPVDNGDILFYLVVQVANGMQGTSTNVLITNSPLMVELATISNGVVTTDSVVTLKGSVSIESSANVGGNVYTYWAEGVEDVAVKFYDENNTTVEMTDENGDYMHPDIPLNNMYTIEPEKDGNDPNGLSTFALFVGQRFILGMNPLEITSPYQIIAGDANCSESFTTLDLFLIQQIIIGTNDEFNSCPSWVFVKEQNTMPEDFNAYNVFPYEDNETMMITNDTLVDFIGVKVGDILGHANPHNFGGYSEERVDDELTLQLENRSYNAGETVELNFKSPNFSNIVSYQMGLEFDNAVLSFEDFEDPSNPSLSSTAIGTNDAIKGDLRVSWFSTNGNSINVDQNEQLFTLRFIALDDIHNIGDYIAVNSEHIFSEAHNGNLDRMDIVLEFVQQTTAVETVLEKEGYSLEQNTPNPFTSNTNISFELPSSMSATITIHNQLGETIKVIEGDYNKGYNTHTLAQENLGTGVFYYTLKTKDFNATRSMISIK